MKKKTIAVIFGGRSTEHDVSIVTALASIIRPLKLTGKYHVEPVYIAKDGAWYWDAKLADISFYQSGEIEQFVKKAKPAFVQLSGRDKLVLAVAGSRFKRGRKAEIDVVFPAMHGTHGEDGELMGLLEMAGVPYVGCPMPASVLAMDKVLAKTLAQAQGIDTPKFISFSSRDYAADADEWVTRINKNLHYPLFVKPAHLGSSIGISRVTEPGQLRNALEVAAHYDDTVLVEEGVQNLIEVTLPIIGNDEPVAAYLEQPMTKGEDFFDFETKYMQGGKGKGSAAGAGAKADGKQGAQGYSQIPADISKELSEKAEAVGLAVYRALGCQGVARIDMLIDKKAKKVYFNEVNPLPGSLYAHNWQRKGVSNVELVTRLVGYAEARATERERLQTTFDTSYLKQF